MQSQNKIAQLSNATVKTKKTKKKQNKNHVHGFKAKFVYFLRTIPNINDHLHSR